MLEYVGGRSSDAVSRGASFDGGFNCASADTLFCRVSRSVLSIYSLMEYSLEVEEETEAWAEDTVAEAEAEDTVAGADRCRAPVDAVKCSAPEEDVGNIWIDLKGIFSEEEEVGAPEVEEKKIEEEVGAEADEDQHGRGNGYYRYKYLD
jgi:hypothetical protein